MSVKMNSKCLFDKALKASVNNEQNKTGLNKTTAQAD